MMDVLRGPSQEQLSAEAVLQASLQRVKWLGAFCHAAYLSKLMYRMPLSRDKCMLHINNSFAKLRTQGEMCFCRYQPMCAVDHHHLFVSGFPATTASCGPCIFQSLTEGWQGIAVSALWPC